MLTVGKSRWMEWVFTMVGGGLVAKSCLTLSDAMGYNPLVSSVHGILQTRILEWVVISSSRGSSWSRDRTRDSYIADGFFTELATKIFQL